MMEDKRGAAGETILTIYRIVIISLIALVIMGLSAVFYDYYIDVRDAEAVILMGEVVNCLVPLGVGKLDLDSLDGNADFDEDKILEYCGFDSEDGVGERFYVNVTVKDDAGKVIGVLQDGDSGVSWVQSVLKVRDITKYHPGHFKGEDIFEVRVVKEGREINGKLSVEVLVVHEF